MTAIAHSRIEKDVRVDHKLKDHLYNVASLTSENAKKIDLPKAGELIGLLHDLGKYSKAFQNYIGSATGNINQDEDEYVDAGILKGKIDHSTAGAKYIWKRIANEMPAKQAVFQILSICIAGHHSGLIDCIDPDGNNVFKKRMDKSNDKCHFDEVISHADNDLINKINELISGEELFFEGASLFRRINKEFKNELLKKFHAGFAVRMLFSCLIDADRTDTANFMKPQFFSNLESKKQIDWEKLIYRLENKLKDFESNGLKSPVDDLRKQIADTCLLKANNEKGIFTLTVPTGGGKTLSSLRFALHHAKKHELDRVIYVIPYTSIIDQNARIVREILEVDKSEKGEIVLEHHSNLVPELHNLKTKVLSENWGRPVIFTTIVQFLESLFSGGTRGARRMHQLARSVIVFDEIQTLPIRTIHLFCNAVNFLTKFCHSSVVLCTATQPLLNKVNEDKGCIRFSEKNEIITDLDLLFRKLKRVEIHNKIKTGGWSTEEIALLALEQISQSTNCLIIVNTKKNARDIYESLTRRTELKVIHLSTSMCPAHRMNKLNEIKDLLDKDSPFFCVSTQLIEAGVDVDFGSVIRFVAGVDSIAQAAGRCNRNGKRPSGKVIVINPKEETISTLHDIKIGRDITNRIFYELSNPEANLPNDLLNPKVMERYFQYYFHNRSSEMNYQVDIGRNDSLLNLLSENSFSASEYCRINGDLPEMYFLQSFATAGREFKAIDSITQGIVVPYSKKGRKVVADFFSKFAVEKQFKLVTKAQSYTVNALPNVISKLTAQKAIRVVPEIGVMVLTDPRFYHPEFGLTSEIKVKYSTLISS